MTVKELWVQENDEIIAVKVLFLYKATGAILTQAGYETAERMQAVCYHPETGKVLEYDLCLTFLKTIANEKTGKLESFSCPEQGQGDKRKESR